MTKKINKDPKPTARTVARRQELAGAVTTDRDDTQRMIDNPDATLAHAMTRLFAVSGEYAPYTYWQAITRLQDLRDALCEEELTNQDMLDAEEAL